MASWWQCEKMNHGRKFKSSIYCDYCALKISLEKMVCNQYDMWVFVVIWYGLIWDIISCAHHPMKAARAARRSLLIWMGAEAAVGAFRTDGEQINNNPFDLSTWFKMVSVFLCRYSRRYTTQGFDLLKRMVVLLYHFSKCHMPIIPSAHWVAMQVHWLLWAYLLEFKGFPLRPVVWMARNPEVTKLSIQIVSQCQFRAWHHLALDNIVKHMLPIFHYVSVCVFMTNLTIFDHICLSSQPISSIFPSIFNIQLIILTVPSSHCYSIMMPWCHP